MEHMAPTPAPQISQGVLGKIKAHLIAFNFEEWTEKVGGSSADLLRAGLSFFAGFAVGFLFKKYLKTAVISLITSVVIIKWLEMNGVLTIEWDVFKTLMGIESGVNLETMVPLFLSWCKDHSVVCVAAVGGGIVGHRLG